MKHIKAFAIILLFMAVNTLSAQSLKDWPELNSYHDVISRTFHPAEEGNLEPIKTFSETLTQKADELTKNAIPVAFNNKKVKDAVKNLQAKSKEVHILVARKASDAEIKKALTEAHDVFHEIVGLCTGEKH
jgi:hypothetical protein